MSIFIPKNTFHSLYFISIIPLNNQQFLFKKCLQNHHFYFKESPQPPPAPPVNNVHQYHVPLKFLIQSLLIILIPLALTSVAPQWSNVSPPQSPPFGPYSVASTTLKHTNTSSKAATSSVAMGRWGLSVKCGSYRAYQLLTAWRDLRSLMRNATSSASVS